MENYLGESIGLQSGDGSELLVSHLEKTTAQQVVHTQPEKKFLVLFGDTPPHPLVYEWISLKGQGAMSSSTGNTIGPLEALELVPPEILRYLIASTKPKKAITFDAGMSLVELADEYERLLSRNLEEEMVDDSLSRRQKVALEDAEGALRMSKIGDSGNTNVSFRHLAMLAQVKVR